MQTSGQNQGGQGHDDRNERRDQKGEHKGENRESIRGYNANVWHKIEGGVAKDKISNFKQELKGQEGQQEAVFKKKRRRRRRKKNKVEGSVQAQNLNQNFPQKDDAKENLKKTIEAKKNEQFAKKEVEVSPFEYEQSIQESGDVPSFEDDEEKEEKIEEPIFSDEEVVEEQDVPVVQEEVEATKENEVAKEAETPSVTEVTEVSEVPEVFEAPEVAETPEEFESNEAVETPTEEQIVQEVYDEKEIPEITEVTEVPEVPEIPEEPEVIIQREDIPPIPPVQQVQPINPFDFPPNTSAEPINPSTSQEKTSSHKSMKMEDKPVNPFDLTEPSSTIDDKRRAEVEHSVPHINQGVNEKVESPDDIGESDESKSVNYNDSSDVSVSETENGEVDRKPEVIEVKATDVKERKIEPVFPDRIDQENVVSAQSKEDFWMILEHAGLTKKKLVMIGVGLISVVLIGLFLILGGMNLFSSVGGDKSTVKRSVTTQENVQVKPVSTTVDQKSSSVVERRPYDVISSYIFGLEYQKPANGIQAQPITAIGTMGGVDAGLVFGKIVNLKQERFVEYVQLLDKMNNIYNVDLYAMLDLSIDRRATLNQYLNEMNNLIDQGGLALATIQGDLEEYNTQYSATSTLASNYEKSFYTQIRNYYGQTAYDSLQFFMDASAQAGKAKAQYGAENTLKNMFINSLNALRPRAKDISTNTEALVKGVRVFDIKGSDINAIVPVN